MTDLCIIEGLPDNSIVFPISTIDIVVDPDPHPLYVQQKDRIRDNWESEVAAQPALYDGQMLLHRDILLEDGQVNAVAHLVPFSTFLWWRKQPGRIGAVHVFATAVVISSDGAVIAVKMSEHTANPGKVYCAAGSLDMHDIVGDRVDIDANMARELAEETGLDLNNAVAGKETFGLWQNRCLTIFRLYRFDQTADALIEAIHSHMVHDHEQEIAGAVAIWSNDPRAHDYGLSMPVLLDFYFKHGF